MQQFLQQVANNGSAAAAAATGAGGPGTGVPGFNPAQLHHLMQQQQTFLSHHQVSGFLKLYIPSSIKSMLQQLLGLVDLELEFQVSTLHNCII